MTIKYEMLQADTQLSNRVQPEMPKYQLPEPKDDIDRAMAAFLTGNVGVFGKYYAVANALVYRTILTNNYGQEVSIGENVIALRIMKNNNVLFLGNSSILPLIGRTTSFGNERVNRGETEIQRRLSSFITMIPFSVFREANLNLKNINILERGNVETVARKIENPKYGQYRPKEMKKKAISKHIEESVHFTGYTLFEIDGKHFLFDIDREEIKHKIFNPFLVQIPKPVFTMVEAYNALMPDMVLESLSKGLKIKRQGEWYFIPTDRFDSSPPNDIELFETTKENPTRRFILRAGNNRPNYASKGFTFNGINYVNGTIEHSGREHRNVVLNSWHIVMPNTAVNSFTIVGDID